MSENEIIHHTGKRKTAIARVYLRTRKGAESSFQVNHKGFKDYFPREASRNVILSPLEITSTNGQYDIYVNVRGGGVSGQADAVKCGIARALINLDSTYRSILKKAGLLTRDAREVERKKYGQSGARRRYQYSKR